MSQENVELVRTGYAAINRAYTTGDWQPFIRHFEATCHPEIVLKPSGILPESAEMRGREGFLQFAISQTTRCGSNRRSSSMPGTGLWCRSALAGRRHTGLDIEFSVVHVWTVRDGKAERLDMYRTKAEALEAVAGHPPSSRVGWVTRYYTVVQMARRQVRRRTVTATRQRSFRLNERLLERLDRQARLGRSSANALAQRLIDEGLRMDEHPQIGFREAAGGRRPALAGTRLDVWQVIETLRANGNSIAAAAEYLNQPAGRVEAAIGYYADYQDEVDVFADRARAIAEEEEAAFRRRQEVLA